MIYKVGDTQLVKINKIQENGCFCSFIPLYLNQYGFMPKTFMPSYIDDNGDIAKNIGDKIVTVIKEITDRGIILCDVQFYIKEQERLKKKEEMAQMQARIESFVSKFEVGTIFEAEVTKILNSKIIISLGDIQGIIRKEDTNWNEIDRLEDVLYEGETINAVYYKYENNQVYFSIKHLNEKPYEEELYNKSLDELLNYAGHKSNVFIGQAKQYYYGLFIENLYSVSEGEKGKLLIDPIYGYNLRAIVPNANFNVEEGKYYKVILSLSPKKKRIERNQLFQFIATGIEEISNPYKADVSLAFQRNTTNPAANQRDAKLLDEIGKNMYSSKDRMFFELIQNADDAAAEKGVLVYVKTNEDYLIVKHNGYSFDKDDFVSITTAANGTKKANENKTGYKGIGFKSVFTDSVQVYISTGGYKFKFDKDEPIFQDFDEFYLNNNPMIINEETKNRFLGLYSDYKRQFDGIHSIPWQLEPLWVDTFPLELGEDFTTTNVAIALKLGANKINGNNGYCQAIDEIIDNPKFMLFLRNTKRIDFNGRSVSKTTKDGIITLKNSFGTNRIEYFKREDYEVPVNNSVFEDNGINIRIQIDDQDETTGAIIEAKFVDLHNQELENIPKKIAINNSTSISFAVSIDEEGNLKPNTECSEISMFAFLPTLVKDFKFPFYINANFVLDPPRQRILGDNPWNFYLMQEIARTMVSWCASLNKKRDKNALNVLISKYFDESTPDTKQLAYHFNSAYKSALESEAFILNYKGKLSKQSEIIIDKTDLSDIIGPELFCSICAPEKALPSSEIDASILDKKIFDGIEKLGFDDVIELINNNEAIKGWFVAASDEKKNLLYEWIDDNNILSRKDNLREFVSNLPLFSYNGEYKSRKEIDSVKNIITTNHISPVKEILIELGIGCSDNILEETHPLYDFIETQDEETIFNTIKESDFSKLDSVKRTALFLALKDFYGVGESKLKDIPLFKNMNGLFRPLKEMISHRENAPIWMKDYILCAEDNNSEISGYLVGNDKEFEDVIWKHRDDYGISISDLYSQYPWSDGKYTIQLINQYKNTGSYSMIFPIVEKSGEDVKRSYLQNVTRVDISQTEKYDKESFEYKVLHLVLSLYEDPTTFSSKIFYQGHSIKEFTISDEVVCDYNQNEENKKVKMSLARLIPRYQNQSDSIEIIKGLFDNGKDLDIFFAAQSKQLYDVHKELNEILHIPEAYFSEWNVEGNAQQYLFATYYRRQKKGWNNLYVPKIALERESNDFINELLDFLYNNNITIDASPFTYHLKTYFQGKSFKCDYIFDNEQLLPSIEQWADNEKKVQYLEDNGVKRSSCHTIKFRQLFIENNPIDFLEKLSDDELNSGIDFISKVDKVIRPFKGDNQLTILLQIKNRSNRVLLDNIDLNKLRTGSEEWDTQEYIKWQNQQSITIKIAQGKLPHLLKYGEILLAEVEDGSDNYYYDKQTKELFISDTNKMDDTLFEAARDNNTDLTFDDYKVLCLEGKITVTEEDIVRRDKKIESLSESIQSKDRIIERYRAKYGDLDDIYSNSGMEHITETTSEISEIHLNAQDEIDTQKQKIIGRDGLSRKEQEIVHDEAARVIKINLESKGYDCSNWILDEDDSDSFKAWHSVNQVDSIISPNGEKFNLVYKSAKGGYIYLSATDFEFLTSNSKNVLMVWDGTSVHSVNADDIFNKDSNVNLIFDTEYTPKHYYAALSKVFQYVKRTTFAVKNPKYTAYDSIKAFGMDSKTEGVQELFDDNDL